MQTVSSPSQFCDYTDSEGYFFIGLGNHKRVKESVFVFRSTDAFKWIYRAHTGATLSIKDCFVIASSTIETDIINLTKQTAITASAPTHPFPLPLKEQTLLEFFSEVLEI